ncbi:hypothetical protein [Rhizobium sp. Rhizsp82]|uniref:hypothetical protein n=1 Tax=Rhizobium sp. Rhizsp82 TaxID=3243057 RepID=UPI0039B54983
MFQEARLVRLAWDDAILRKIAGVLTAHGRTMFSMFVHRRSRSSVLITPGAKSYDELAFGLIESACVYSIKMVLSFAPQYCDDRSLIGIGGRFAE